MVGGRVGSHRRGEERAVRDIEAGSSRRPGRSGQGGAGDPLAPDRPPARTRPADGRRRSCAAGGTRWGARRNPSPRPPCRIRLHALDDRVIERHAVLLRPVDGDRPLLVERHGAVRAVDPHAEQHTGVPGEIPREQIAQRPADAPRRGAADPARPGVAQPEPERLQVHVARLDPLHEPGGEDRIAARPPGRRRGRD